jgi:DNA replication protein DnaC
MTDMTMTDATTLASLLTELRLPSIARNWKRITEAANREGWPAQKTLATLLEIEVAERASRHIQRHRDQSETPVGNADAQFELGIMYELG